MISEVELMLGNCLKEMDKIPDKSVQLILADLPYGITMCDFENDIPLDKLWEHYKRVLDPAGCVLLFGMQPFTSRLVSSNLDWFKYCLIWNKNKSGSPGLAKHQPMRVHEDIVVFAPKKTVYNPIMQKGEPYARQSKNPEGYVGKKNDHKYGLKPVKGFTNEGTRYPKSIINISRDFSAQQQQHPTQKPVPLLEYLIKTYSNIGDTVLDNVMGVGSTGVAAKNLQRDFIGIELSESYYDIAVDRILGEQQKVA